MACSSGVGDAASDLAGEYDCADAVGLRPMPSRPSQLPRLSRLVRRLSNQHSGIDPTLGYFFGSLVRWSVIAAVAIAVLQVFGIPATSFVAVLGALTLAIGLSLQGALGNIASGVMIMIFRPYKLGDYIEIALNNFNSGEHFVMVLSFTKHESMLFFVISSEHRLFVFSANED